MPANAIQPSSSSLMMPPSALDSGMDQTGIDNAETTAFRQMMDKQIKVPSMRFDGGKDAMHRAIEANQAMQSLNTGAMSKIIGLDIDKEFDFLTQMLIQHYKDPDPSKENDQTQHILAVITMVSAGNQAKMAKELEKNSGLIAQQTRLVTENRIGKKVQYQDSFVEVRDEDGKLPIYYRLGKDAQTGSIKIMNDHGRVVQTLSLEDLKKGDHKIEWDLLTKEIKDGDPVRASSGVYYLQVEVFDHDKKPVPHIMELEGVVSTIDTDENGLPVYYIGGIKVDGRITKVSEGRSEGGALLQQLRQYRFDPITTKPINPGEVQEPLGGVEALIPDAVAANNALLQPPPVIDVDA